MSTYTKETEKQQLSLVDITGLFVVIGANLACLSRLTIPHIHNSIMEPYSGNWQTVVDFVIQLVLANALLAMIRTIWWGSPISARPLTTIIRHTVYSLGVFLAVDIVLAIFITIVKAVSGILTGEILPEDPIKMTVGICKFFYQILWPLTGPAFAITLFLLILFGWRNRYDEY